MHVLQLAPQAAITQVAAALLIQNPSAAVVHSLASASVPARTEHTAQSLKQVATEPSDLTT